MSKRKIIAAAGMTAALATGGIVGATLGYPNTSGAQDDTTTTAPADPSAPQGEGRDHGGRGGGVELDAAATALGLSTDELRTQLQDGKTIAEVATAQDVDEQVVIDAMVAAAEARLEEQKAALPERMAAIVDGTAPAGGPGGGKGGPGGHGGRGGPGGQGLTAAAKALGLTEDELRTALEADDASLATVAEAEGVDVQVVIDALVAEAKTHIAAQVEDGGLTQAEADERIADLTERITDRVNSTDGPGRGGPGGPGRGERPPADDAPAEGSTTTTEGN